MTANSVINLSLLEALRGEKSVDELDIYLPFLAMTLIKLNKDEFVVSDVSEKLVELFGFSPPISALKVLLARCRKNGFFTNQNGLMVVNQQNVAKVSEGYKKKTKNIERSVSRLKNDFKRFSEENFFIEFECENSINVIYEFIEENISEFVEVLNKNDFSKKVKKSNRLYIVAAYIAHLNSISSCLIDDLEIMVKGVILANFMYHADLASPKSKYRNITIMLDGPIIVTLLGYSGDMGKDEVSELLSLLRKLDICVCIYRNTYDEIEGLLRAWKRDMAAKNYDKFNPKTLMLLRAKGYDDAVFETDIALLENRIETFGISIVDAKKIEPEFACDEAGFEKLLRRFFKRSMRHDVFCLSRVVNSRKNRKVESFNDSFSIFVTFNRDLERAANRFFHKIINGGIPLAASEGWIASSLWLKHPEVCATLPKDILISNAYGAIGSDTTVWVRFLGRVKQLNVSGKINDEDYHLVRFDRYLISNIRGLEIRKGDELNDSDIFDLVEETKRRLLKEKDSQIQTLENENRLASADLKSIESSISSVAKIVALIPSAIVCLVLLFMFGFVTIEPVPEITQYYQVKKYSVVVIYAVIYLLAIVMALYVYYKGVIFRPLIIRVYELSYRKAFGFLYGWLIKK